MVPTGTICKSTTSMAGLRTIDPEEPSVRDVVITNGTSSCRRYICSKPHGLVTLTTACCLYLCFMWRGAPGGKPCIFYSVRKCKDRLLLILTAKYPYNSEQRQKVQIKSGDDSIGHYYNGWRDDRLWCPTSNARVRTTRA